MRSPESIDERIRDGRDLPGLARGMVLAIAGGAAVFGASVGAYRGGIQILFAAVKFPLVLLLTAAVCAPTLTALGAALGGSRGARRDLSVVLSALAVTSLVLATGAPVLVLAGLKGAQGQPLVGYHGMALLLFAVCAAAGAAGLRTFRRRLGRSGPRGHQLIGIAALAVFAVVGAQMSWTFRPYLVRPRSEEVVFMRNIEGNLLDSIRATTRSARGDYDEAETEPALPDGVGSEVEVVP